METGSQDTGSEPGLARPERTGERGAREPEIDAVLHQIGIPHRLLHAVRRELARTTELTGQRLAHAPAVPGANERPKQLRDEQAVHGVAWINRRDEVKLLIANRPDQRGHPFRRKAGDLGVEHDDGAGAEQVRHREDSAEGVCLAGHPVVRRADAVRRAQVV